VSLARTVRWLATAGAIATASCSGGHHSTAAPRAAPRPPRLLRAVAIENVWGSILAQLAGETASVSGLLTDPNADPHSYEASADDARALAEADYVVENGAGYDPWAARLLAGNPNPARKVTVLAQVFGKSTGDNPHFWYSPALVARAADVIQADLTAIERDRAAYFAARRRAFDASSRAYQNRVAAVRALFSGVPVGSTENMFEYLAEALGLRLITPPEFMRAVAAGNDPPAPSVVEFQSQISERQIRVLVFNRQTATAVTTNLTKLAEAHGIPTVGITEVIEPPTASFQQWQEAQVTDLEGALQRSLAGATGWGRSP